MFVICDFLAKEVDKRNLLKSKERDTLKRRIEQRPSKQILVRQHILLTASNADASIQQKTEELKLCKLRDDLNRKLQHRPGPLELITKKILQADAELEQAIQEGRLSFTKTNQGNEVERKEEESEMEVISAAASTYTYPKKVPNVCLVKSKLRRRGSQYRTPYVQTLPSPNARSKLKTQDSAVESNQDTETLDDGLANHGVSYMSDSSSLLNVTEQASSNENTCEMQSSYDLLLQQQQLFLQWQREVEESRTHGSLQENEERRPYQDECASSSGASRCVTPSVQKSLMGTDCIQTGVQSVISEQGQDNQQCCRCSSVTLNDSEISGIVNPVSDIEKPKSRLADYRVQDLKNECKKRQLPVSGPKPQLLERLKPYEESILNQSCTATFMDSSSCEPASIPSPISDTAASSNRLPPISNVIGNYGSSKHSSLSPLIQRAQSIQPHSFVVQLPPAQQRQHQVLHLVDANGAVVATATVPPNMQCCCKTSDHSQTSNISVNDNTTSRSLSDRYHQHNSNNNHVTQNMVHQVQNEPTFSFAQLGSGGQFTLVRQSSAEQLQHENETHSSCSGQHQHQETQLTQSTLISSCNSKQQTHSGTGAVFSSCDDSHQQQTQGSILSSFNAQHQQQAQLTQGTILGNAVLNCQLTPSPASPDQRVVGAGSHQLTAVPLRATKSQQQLYQVQIQHSGTTTTCFKQHNRQGQYFLYNNVAGHSSKEDSGGSQNVLCPSMQSAQPHCSPVTADSASGSSPDIPSPPNNVEKLVVVEAVPTHIDPSDTNALLSATTLSIHEEMLRFQQRKIEELQKELHHSQQQLKHQQQIILAAKKAQQAKRQENAQHEGYQQQSDADLWLNQLDIKHLNKFHIQLFLQHKLQQQQMQADSFFISRHNLFSKSIFETKQFDIGFIFCSTSSSFILVFAQITEQQNLATTEEKLQEELHVEQAVQDIVRLIKQDARTALLIVQLLRRYQLERNQAVAAVTQIVENPSCEKDVQQDVQKESKMTDSVVVDPQIQQPVNVAIKSVHNALQPQTSVVIIEDDLQRFVSSSSMHFKHKSRKKNVLRAKSDADSQEKPSTSVDMEEIFKQVLENASKALLESDSGKRSKANLSSSSGFPEDFVTHKETPSSSLQQYEVNTVVVENNNNNTTLLPSCDQLIQPYNDKVSPISTVYAVDQTMGTDIGCRFFEDVEVVEERTAGTPQVYQYSKNQSFDDLMDVLRDDQTDAQNVESNDLDVSSTTVYGTDELAALLGDDWFQNDCAMIEASISSQTAEQYISSEAVIKKVGTAEKQILNYNDSLMAHNCIQPIDQNTGMDWLDMMLPAPSPVSVGLDNSEIGSIV
ncbi:unnamed protein product [Thelazia callipaeda]|uniref:SAP domain-containing protein n=1 Tax=Thelazia callipaeda TaxID=103827 RepID=A0A0N5CU56_THECL|nr:unnamed protein product [Thelazia callipaeda]